MKKDPPFMTHTDHIERHKLLHQHLDELVADWIGHTSTTPSQKTVMDLMKWSYSQTLNPTEREGTTSDMTRVMDNTPISDTKH